MTADIRLNVILILSSQVGVTSGQQTIAHIRQDNARPYCKVDEGWADGVRLDHLSGYHMLDYTLNTIYIGLHFTIRDDVSETPNVFLNLSLPRSGART